jgi:hypothetical protein
MSLTFEEKLNKFIKKINDEILLMDKIKGFKLTRTSVTTSFGKVYVKILYDSSVRFFVEIESERIYGSKSFTQPNKNHYHGTLDEIDDRFWGDYAPMSLKSWKHFQDAHAKRTKRERDAKFKDVLKDIKY